LNKSTDMYTNIGPETEIFLEEERFPKSTTTKKKGRETEIILFATINERWKLPKILSEKGDFAPRT
jgi:hypothetical protein